MEVGKQCRHVYFPTADGFISVMAALHERASLEVGIVGSEGMLGVSLILGVNIAPLHAVVQVEGPALRMDARAFRFELERSPALKKRLNCYAYVLMSQLAQTAICTGYHLIQARLARWLLMTRDRVCRDSLHLTHESLANMLGVRRVGITRAAGSLEALKLIRYSRGRITVLDHLGLYRVACQCYQDGIDTYDQILGATRSPAGPLPARTRIHRRKRIR